MGMLSLYEFKAFVRMNLKLTFWDVCNTDIEDFYRYLDRNGGGISVDELIAFVRSNNHDRPKEFSFLDTKADESTLRRMRQLKKKKTYKQQLLEESLRPSS